MTESCDIPTWYTGDEWVYDINPINYVGVNGSFFGKVENLKYEVIDITSIISWGRYLGNNETAGVLR